MAIMLNGCPARIPMRKNVLFFATPEAAEAAGFRACLRCRPGSPDDGGCSIGKGSSVGRVAPWALAGLFSFAFAARRRRR